MRRRNRQNPFSLFSFQDIITGLAGIMVFLVLVQVVGQAMGREIAAENESPTDESDQSMAQLRNEIAVLERRLAGERERTSKVIVTVGDRARTGDVAKVTKDLTEKERIIAALVSQVHDLETKVAAARDADAQDREKIKEMERTRRLLEQKMSSMKGRKGITLIPERSDFKIPVYLICDRGGIEAVSPFEKNFRRRTISAEEVSQELGNMLDNMDHTTHAVVLLVRPSGVKWMDLAVELLKERRFAYGRDPLEEGVEIAFEIGGGK